MFECKLVRPSLKTIALGVCLPAKPNPGEYVFHEGVLYYVHGCVLYTNEYIASTLVKVTEA